MDSGQQIVDYPSALDFLYGRIDYERNAVIPYRSMTFKLDRMRELLSRLGNPHHAVKAVHVAGTKGKGSTCAMVSAALIAAGYDVGMFTSPHLERLEERFRFQNEPCRVDELVDLAAQIQPVVQAMDREAAATSAAESGPTYFEVTTAMGLLFFCQRAVDLAVIEVGLGGRLDSTNVCLPVVSVITSISFDHTKQLGNTLQRIAKEKAGIIKPGIPVISGVRDAEPRKPIRDAAHRWGCRLLEIGRDFDVIVPSESSSQPYDLGGVCNRMDYRESPDIYLTGLDVNLAGQHQLENAAVAIAALHALRQEGWDIDESALRKGLANVVWPARAEIFAGQPTIVLDTAHNVASMDALADVITKIPVSGRRWLLFAASSDKDIRGMLRSVLPVFDEVILTQFESQLRTTAPELLAEEAKQVITEDLSLNSEPNIHILARAADAWQLATERAASEDLICVTGSFFIAAELRKHIEEQCRTSQVAVSER
ncbi:MAG: bifunctional folylpolyglutamate synthase/dihydrofolate synthase [Pirellulaceae bacterium]|nr:bifunctional folylpolyglutamate synthase/dihydrofolate synthase [Pirellulaceae bacterium]